VLEPAFIAKVAAQAIEVDAAQVEIFNRFAALMPRFRRLGDRFLQNWSRKS
jgi:hypothetical protein